MKRTEMIRLMAEAIRNERYRLRELDTSCVDDDTFFAQAALDTAEKNGMVLRDGSDENIDNVNFSWEDEA